MALAGNDSGVVASKVSGLRRGLCNHCRHTLTALPVWCVPRASYSLRAREQAITWLADGCGLAEAAPDCRDPDRVADSSTIRRWVWRRMESFPFWLGAVRLFFSVRTILAWDFRAAARILIVEPSPP